MLEYVYAEPVLLTLPQSSVISSPNSSFVPRTPFLTLAFDCMDVLVFDRGSSGDDDPARFSSLISLYS